MSVDSPSRAASAARASARVSPAHHAKSASEAGPRVAKYCRARWCSASIRDTGDGGRFRLREAGVERHERRVLADAAPARHHPGELGVHEQVREALSGRVDAAGGEGVREVLSRGLTPRGRRHMRREDALGP